MKEKEEIRRKEVFINQVPLPPLSHPEIIKAFCKDTYNIVNNSELVESIPFGALVSPMS